MQLYMLELLECRMSTAVLAQYVVLETWDLVHVIRTPHSTL
jgi:hypothetical protein